MNITETLFANRDLKYKDFTARLVPNIPKDSFIGVRTPFLKAYAKELVRQGSAETFLSELPHKYQEENNLHAFILNLQKDFAACIERLDEFLPFVDNWATCDGIRPVCFTKNKDKLIPHIFRWISSDKPYTVRFGIEMLMTHYLDADFGPDYLKAVAEIKSDEYYFNMMIAWYFATALSKQWDSTVKYLENKSLSPWIHNKTISKANDSFRITKEQKEVLKKLKI